MHATDLNGVGKIGNKLYLTGGVNEGEDEANFPHILNQTWAHGEQIVSKLYRYYPATTVWMARAPRGEIAGPIVRVFVNGQARLLLPAPGIRPEDGPTTGHSFLYTP